MRFRTAVATISTFCFGVALAGYALVNNFLASMATGSGSMGSTAISVLSTIGIYTIAFQLIYWLYTEKLYRLLDRRLDLSGTWYQVMIVDQDSDRPYYRFGPCTIKAEADQVTISGSNYRAHNDLSSTWQSELAAFSENKLLVQYVSEGARRENPTTRGTMVFNLDGTPPRRLQGCFDDARPARHSGAIQLFRDKAEYEQYLGQLLSADKPA